MARRGRTSRSGSGDGLPDAEETAPSIPVSFESLLGEFGGCFSAWTFPVFCALACGLVAQVTRRTVCQMLVGARLSGTWSHHRAHRFFSHARWSTDEVSATVVRLVVRLLVAPGEAVTVAVDDSLFNRRGPHVHAVGWFHDGSAVGARKIGFGNNWVIAAVVVRLPFLSRPLALPVGFALVRKNSEDASRLEAARRLVANLAEALPGRRIDVVADSAYAGRVLKDLPPRVTWTTRLRSNAALYDLAPPRTGRRGRPREKGDQLPALALLSAKATYTSVKIARYGAESNVDIAVVRCLWYRVFAKTPVNVVFVRDSATKGYDVALVTTDLDATSGEIVERYAARWSIEVAIEDAKGTIGVGEAQNRVRLAVERTVPFCFTVGTLAVLWYATVGHHPDDVNEVRARSPWYRAKAQPSVLDMFAKLRRVVIAAQFRREGAQDVTPAEINLIRLAWEGAAA